MRERESGFDLSFHTDKLGEYNPLFDRNLRHHFESRHIQKTLHSAGLVRAPCGGPRVPAVADILCAARRAQVDHDGHVVDLSKNKGKLSIIEQEFREAERLEQLRLREEEDIRVRACHVWCAAAWGLLPGTSRARVCVFVWARCSGVCRRSDTRRWSGSGTWSGSTS